MFKRKIYEQLAIWKKTMHGKTALLIEGARRIGKSTIALEFAKNEYKSFILIDFSVASKQMYELFDDVSNLDYIFLQLQLLYSTTLIPHESLIIFDEVQLCPKARQAIKQLVKDGRYDYIETGSLISIHKNTKDILIPSEETKVEMYPMDFEEFLWAIGDDTSLPLLKNIFAKRTALGDNLHRKLMRTFRLYMLVGGMPQAVDTYLHENNFVAVDEIKRSIINLYEEDFYKISPSGTLAMLFDAIPAQLAKKASRYQISSVIAHKQAADLMNQLSELRASKTVLMAYHANDPNVGMAGSLDLEKFKIYMADTGLFVTLAFKDADFTQNEIYTKLLSDKLPANLGAVYENVVAQELSAHGHKLYYYTWPKEGANRNYEIDFLIPDGKKISPIEVKSSRYKTHASLDNFSKKFSARVGKQYLIYTKDYASSEGVMCIPTYFCSFL